MKASYRVTGKLAVRLPHYGFAVVEGSSTCVREVVSLHRTKDAAKKAASKWKAPARVSVLNTDTWHDDSDGYFEEEGNG